MPCIGCIKRREIDMGVKGNFKMKFVGRPNGKLMKNAPGNFIHGKVYTVPYGHSKWPFWEMLEPEPVLRVPDEEESFEEAYFVPEESEVSVTESAPIAEITVTPSYAETVPDPNAPAILEPYMMFSPKTGKMSAVEETPEEPTPESEPEPEAVGATREDLLDILKQAGVPVKPRTRTTTLRKMVEALEETD